MEMAYLLPKNFKMIFSFFKNRELSYNSWKTVFHLKQMNRTPNSGKRIP